MRVRGLAFFFLVGSCAAQFDGTSTVRRITVHVSLPTGSCDPVAQVRLVGHSGQIAQGSLNDRCDTEFFNIPAGSYQLIVTGRAFSITNDIIAASSGSDEFEVKVKSVDTKEGAPTGSFVSANELLVPAKARKEFDKANQLVGEKDFKRAIGELNKAIAIYPNYASAYNNLGVVYADLGDHDKEREALQKAVGIDEHFAPAYVNLGRMDIGAKDFNAAEADLSKANSYDPTDAMTLVLLAFSQFMNHHFDDAIATAARAHGLAGGHAFAHQVAARAFEQKRDGPSAITQLELFLKEEPTGQRAEVAQKELDNVRKVVRSLQAKGQ